MADVLRDAAAGLLARVGRRLGARAAKGTNDVRFVSMRGVGAVGLIDRLMEFAYPRAPS